MNPANTFAAHNQTCPDCEVKLIYEYKETPERLQQLDDGRWEPGQTKTYYCPVCLKEYPDEDIPF